ncbi:Non-specific lipid transfer protein GPI-anchored 1 [Linum perenne]
MRTFLILLSVVVAAAVMVAGAGENLGTECAKDFQSVMTCLAYAQGKQGSPSKECCDSIKSIKDNEPKCLCFIMQQTHNGSAQFKSMGIQESKLLQLPTACQLHNATISFCPRLLGLPPNSPDAAIFTNATSASSASPTTPASTTTTTPLPQASRGCRDGGALILTVALVFTYGLFVGPVSGFRV